MGSKNVAIQGLGCYKSLQSLSGEFNIKLLNDEENEKIENDWESPFGNSQYNPFGFPPYWLLVKSQKLKKKRFQNWWCSGEIHLCEIGNYF